MKIKSIFSLLLAGSLFLNISCRNNDDENIAETSKGAYENGFFVANEGSFGTPSATVSFISKDLSKIENGIYGTANSSATLGDVLNSVGFSGDYAYFVVNNSNKVVVANRYTMKKVSEISNLTQPRYIAFNSNKIYITNNDFYSTRQLNIYNSDHTFLKTIAFDRYAEKVVSAGNYVYVQTDGVTYPAPDYTATPTGHTITRVGVSSNAVDKVFTLTDTGMIKDMVSANDIVYVLSADDSASTLYKINGDVVSSVNLGFKSASKIVVDNGQLYILAGNKVYYMPVSAAATTGNFTLKDSNIYGFNVIDGNVFTSTADFKTNSPVTIYDTKGNVLKTFTAGIGANGFYKN